VFIHRTSLVKQSVRTETHSVLLARKIMAPFLSLHLSSAIISSAIISSCKHFQPETCPSAFSDQVDAGWSTENALNQEFGHSDPIPSDRNLPWATSEPFVFAPAAVQSLRA
jgi:hypothetical protein